MRFALLLLLVLLSLLSCRNTQNCTLPNSTSCPTFPLDEAVCDPLATTLLSQPNINYTCAVTIPPNFLVVNLTDAGSYSNLTINTSLVLISGDLTILGFANITYNQMVFNSCSLNVTGALWMYGNITAAPSTQENGLAFVNMSVKAYQMVVYSQTPIVMGMVNITTSRILCTEEWPLSNSTSILINPSQFLTFSYNPYQSSSFSANVNIPFTVPFQTMYNLSLVTSLSMLTTQRLQMASSNISTSVFFSVANQTSLDQYSMVDTGSNGCTMGQGAGRGLNVVSNQSVACGSSGASGAGYGGGGNNNTSCLQNIGFFQFIMHSYPYGLLEDPLVTGSSGSNPNGLCWGTNGGGVIVVQAAEVFNLNGTLNASGGATNSPSQCSAGSAGSINVFTNNLTGIGNIVAAGGASYGQSISGQGSGGWAKIYTLQDVRFFIGTINISGGYRTNNPATADSGNLYYQNCQAGYGPNPSLDTVNITCFSCPEGYFKGLMDVDCMTCPSYPDLKTSSSNGNQDLSSCYQSIVKDANTISLRQFARQIPFIRIVIFNGMILVCICLGIVLKKIYKKKKSRLETQSFDFEKATQDMNNSKIITENLKNQKQFKMADLMYHIHRVTVFGANTYSNPWMLSETPPQELQGIIVADPYEAFVKNLNAVLKWTKLQTYILYPCFIIYPLYWFLLIQIKKKKYKAVVKFIQNTKINFINKELHEDKSFIKIKVSKNTDYTICYLDIFRYNKADIKYFMLSCPYIVYLSGEGNFIRPFYLCETDPFLNVLYFIINRNIQKGFQEVSERCKLMGNLVNQKKRLENSSKLAKFVRQFNRASCTLDLNSPIKNFISGIVTLVDLLTQWNKQFFNKFSVHINLILIITKFDESRIIDHQVTILERTQQDLFGKWMESAINGLQMVEKYDIKFAIFIYNPNQDLDEFMKQRNRQIVEIADRTDKSHALSFKETMTMEQPLIQHSESLSPAKPPCTHKLFRFLGFIRYSFISHRTSTTSKYVLQFFQIVLILFEASYVAMWQNWLTYPYVGVDIIVPFVGIVWIASGNSYGVGKVFLILNAMAFINELTQMIIIFATWNHSNWLFKVLRLITMILQLAIIAVGCRMITFSKKLNQPKIT